MIRTALIYGGDSSEWGISVLSGKYVATCLDPARYEVTELLLRNGQWSVCDPSVTDVAVPVAPFIPSRLKEYDVAVIMIHGTPGENGILQAELERHGLPFTTCSSRVSAITFDKHACKKGLQGVGIPLAPEMFFHRGEAFNPDEVVEKLGLPVFVKPNDGGSSFGVTKVKRQEDLAAAVAAAFSESDDVLIESFIPGRELTEGVFSRGGEIITLPVTEIISHNEYFDYEAKYMGKSDEVCPAQISREVEMKVREQTRRIYQHFGCSGMIRCDYILSESGQVYFLEINPIPGMTKMSLVPAQIRAAGMEVSEVLDSIIADAISSSRA